MSYIRLNRQYALRGFLDIPYLLVNLQDGRQEILNDSLFSLLKLCDGQANLDDTPLSQDQKKILIKLRDKNIVCSFPQPSPLYPEQKYRKADNLLLKSVHWSVTGSCNLRCRHCYISAPRRKYKDLSTKECLNMIEQMEQANVLSVSITGGEPFLRPDLFTLLEAFAEKSIALTHLYTNGLLITENMAMHILRAKLRPKFVISFDGIGSHDWLRGIAGTEEKTLRAIRLLKSLGFPVMIETALCEQNIRQLPETYALMKSLQIDYWKTSCIFEAGNWKMEQHSYLAPQRLYRAYLQLIRQYSADGAPFHIQLDGFFACRKQHLESWHSPYIRSPLYAPVDDLCCGTCRYHPYLLPDGTLLPCAVMTDSFLEKDMPNLARETLSQIYHDTSHPFFRIADMRTNEIINQNEDCASCPYQSQCKGGCRGLSISEGKGLYGHSNTLCAFFHGGYQKKIKEAVKIQRKGGVP